MKAPNAQSSYAALRTDVPGSDGVTVKEFMLEREGGRFYFAQGSFYFYAPVEGRVTGAVFVGTGRFNLAVKGADEQRSLALLTKSDTMSEEFTTLVLRFTDGTADEIRKASAGAADAPERHVREAAQDLAKEYRKDTSDNMDLRILADSVVPHGQPADGEECAVPGGPRGDGACRARPGGADDMERCGVTALGGLQDAACG
jgi:hypothetical protein